MNDTTKVAHDAIQNSPLNGLSDSVQIVLIICGTIVFVSMYLVMFTDFWDNISRRKRN